MNKITITKSDNTTDTFNVKNGTGISNITYTKSTADDGVNKLNISRSNGSTDIFDIKNGTGISSISYAPSSADSGANKLKITRSNGTSDTFNILNGSKGSKGDKGDTGEKGGAFTKTDVIDWIYPIGSIYLTLNDDDPNIKFAPAVWERIASGRTLWSGDGTNTGTELEAGVPNISAMYVAQGAKEFSVNGKPYFYGAFKPIKQNGYNGNSTGWNNMAGVSAFNASDGECGTQKIGSVDDTINYENKVYGKSDTVQPPAIVVNMWRRVLQLEPVVFTTNGSSDYNIKLNKVGSPEDVSLVYSFDNTTWQPFKIGTDYKIGTRYMPGTSHKLYIKAADGVINRFSSSSSDYYQFEITNNVVPTDFMQEITVSGNINSLLGTYELQSRCFSNLFLDCTELNGAGDLVLPSTNLARSCYNSMFLGCSSLRTIPQLPAINLAESCYNSMFYGCSLLKLSTTQDTTYTKSYRIPASGTGKTATTALDDMFAETGGSFTGTPSINTTYYMA